jgi:hypothetical protein
MVSVPGDGREFQIPGGPMLNDEETVTTPTIWYRHVLFGKNYDHQTPWP